MNGFFRVVGNGVWACAFGLSIWLAFELHESKFDIALGVALLSLVLSAIGLLLARVAGKQGDRLGMRIGIVIWMTGAVSFGLTELGFWYGSYKDRHAEYVQVKTTKERQAGLKDMAWDALKTGEVRATSAELTARMKAARQSELWASSGGCGNATTPKSRAFCQGYFEFEATLAKASKLETIEATFLAEKPDATRKTAHSIFTTADFLAENTGMSERTASVVVILVIALVLMLSRDLLPIVANPIGGRREALTAPKDEPVSLVGVGRFPATPEPRAPLPHPAEPWASEAEVQKLRDLVADMKAHGIAPPSPLRGEEPSPIGGGSGSRAPEPATEVATEEAPATEEMAPDPKIVRPAQWHEDSTPPVAPRTNGRRGKKDPTKHLTRKDQIVIQWLADSCSITGDEADVATGGACHTSYRQYCDGRRVPQKDRVAQARMSAILSGQLGTRVNGRGKRNGKEAEFPGLLINPIVAQTQRARKYG